MTTKLLLQHGHGPNVEAVLDALNASDHTVVIAEDDQLISSLSEHGDELTGVVLFEHNEASSRLCRLLRNSRFSHPWTPIAMLCKPHRSLSAPVGSRYFSLGELDQLPGYLSKPHEVEVVVIEDDEGIREYLDLCLSKFYSVQAFPDGESALEHLNAHTCDLVILDVMLPGMNGAEVMRELQKKTAPVPVVVITAYDNPEREANFIAEGAADYLKKPFDNSDTIRDTVMRVLNDTHDRASRAGQAGDEIHKEKAWIDYANAMQKYLN